MELDGLNLGVIVLVGHLWRCWLLTGKYGCLLFVSYFVVGQYSCALQFVFPHSVCFLLLVIHTSSRYLGFSGEPWIRSVFCHYLLSIGFRLPFPVSPEDWVTDAWPCARGSSFFLRRITLSTYSGFFWRGIFLTCCVKCRCNIREIILKMKSRPFRNLEETIIGFVRSESSRYRLTLGFCQCENKI